MSQGFIPFKNKNLKNPVFLGRLRFLMKDAPLFNIRHTETLLPHAQDGQHKVTKKINKKPKNERSQKSQKSSSSSSPNLETFQHYMAMLMTEVYFTRKDGKIPSDSPYCEMDRIFDSDEFQAIKKFHERTQSLEGLDQHKQKGKEVFIIDE